MTIRYYARFAGGETYEVVDSFTDHCAVSPCKPYHEANTEAHERNTGTYGLEALSAALFGWALALKRV